MQQQHNTKAKGKLYFFPYNLSSAENLFSHNLLKQAENEISFIVSVDAE